MPQLVSRIEPAVLCGLQGIQEYEWRAIPPEREGVHFDRSLGKGIDPNTMSFQEMNHAADWALAKGPMLTEGFRSRLRFFTSEIQQIWFRKREPGFDPFV